MSFSERIRRLLPGQEAARPREGVPAGLVPADKLAAQARRDAAKAPSAGWAGAQDPELVAQRDRLVERFTMMQADLGGVLYEMLIRDHVRMDVLTRRAAELQRVDASLAQVERALRGEPGALGGIHVNGANGSNGGPA